MEPIREFAELLLNGGLASTWPLWLTIFALSFTASVLGSYVTSYGGKRGEIYATKKDFEEIKRQLTETTRLSAQIESEVSSGVWVDQQRWELRKDFYLILIRSLNVARKAMHEAALAEFNSDEFQGTEEEREAYIEERLELSSIAAKEVKRVIEEGGILFLSNEAVAVLTAFENAEKK